MRTMLAQQDSIKKKLTAVHIVTSLAALVIASLGYVGYDLVRTKQQIAYDLKATADVMGGNTAAAVSFGDVEVAAEVLSALHAVPNVVCAYVFTPEGLFARYDRDGRPNEPPAAPPAPGAARIKNGRMVVTQTIRLDGQIIGEIYVESDLRRLGTFLRHLVLVMGGILCVSMLAVTRLSERLQHSITGPILSLASAAKAIKSRGDYLVYVPKRSNDEIGALTDAFNDMLREIRERESALQRAREELEVRVEERTRDLQQQIREREKAERALRESEEALRQSQKMEAIGRLAGGVAHDFNNILTAVLGYCEILQMDPELSKVQKGEIDELRKAGERGVSIAGQLLAFSRKQRLELKVVDLNGVISQMNSMLPRLIGEDVRITLKLDPGLGSVRVDPGQIEQVIMNLAVNARDAMPDGGTFAIETHNVSVDAADHDDAKGVKPGAYAMILLRDTGFGMDPALMLKVWEPFFTTKPPGKGTGLGLSTVFGIVTQSGGHITVESEPGKGATFRVFLPRIVNRHDHEIEVVAPVRQSGDRARAATILVVEDERQVRDLMVRRLTDEGFHVVSAGSGVEALQVSEETTGEIGLMITDMMMPIMGGMDLYRQIAPLRPEMKVIFMSGYSGAAVAIHDELPPGTCYLPKPFGFSALTEKVTTMLGGSTAARAAGAGSRVARGLADVSRIGVGL